MDTIQDISESLGQLHLPARLAKPSLSPFLNLPPEIHLLIASFLPLESMGSLSLSCRHLYLCLKHEYLQPLKDADSEVMNSFLQLLERDLPLHIVCHECNKLHFTPLAQRHLVTERFCPDASKAWSKCRATASFNQDMGRTPPSFTSTIFFMAMKAHRQGRPTTALLRLLSHKTIHDTSDAFVELRTSKARIRNGSLLLRDQRVFMFSAPLRPPLTVDGRFEFCRHNVFTNLDDLGFCRIHVPSPDEINDYVSKEGVIYCKYCHTEIRIDFKSYGKARTAMFVTRWMDVGEGRDVDDVKWKFRLASRTEWEEVSFARGSICAAFEGTDDFRFDSLLTEQDEMDLCIMCPLTWPESAQVPDHDWEQGYEVVDGKMVFIDNGAERACFCIHDD